MNLPINMFEFFAFMCGFLGILLITRHMKRKTRLVTLVTVLTLASLLKISESVPCLQKMTVEIKEALLTDKYKASVATGSDQVDRLLVEFQKSFNVNIDFPVLVESDQDFKQSLQVAMPIELNLANLKNIVKNPFVEVRIPKGSDTAHSSAVTDTPHDIVGICLFRPNGSRVVYLNSEFIKGSSEARLAKYVAHEIGHCQYYLRHSADRKSFMYEDIDFSELNESKVKIGDYLGTYR
jgi:hypothetical protein